METIFRKNIFKVTAAALLLCFSANGVNGQDHLDNYVEVTEATLQTVDLPLRIYAYPDPVYNPGYDGTGAAGTGLNANSQWRWVYGGAFTDPAGVQVKDWTAGENWVELLPASLPDAGQSRTFWVAERYDAVCADGTGRSHEVHVIGAPTGTMTGANTGGTWDIIDAGIQFYLCGDGHQDDLSITFSELAPGGVTPANLYAYNITAERIQIDVNGDPVGVPAVVTGVSVAATDAAMQTSPASWQIPAMTFMEVDAAPVRTMYTFTLASVASKTSTVSHIRAGMVNGFYDVAGQTVSYILNLPPVTGPIYHIPNNTSL